MMDKKHIKLTLSAAMTIELRRAYRRKGDFIKLIFEALEKPSEASWTDGPTAALYVYVDERQYDQLKTMAKEAGMSMGRVVDRHLVNFFS